MTTQPWANRAVKPRCGYVYKADGETYITITRVARDGSWADIRVAQPNAEWSKRQPLRDGLLPFPAVIWSTECPTSARRSTTLPKAVPHGE